jgi:hypothetical protein
MARLSIGSILDRFRKKKDEPELPQLTQEQIEELFAKPEPEAPVVPKEDVITKMGDVKPGIVKQVILHGFEEHAFKRWIEVVFYNGKHVTVKAGGLIVSDLGSYEAWKARQIAAKYANWLQGK